MITELDELRCKNSFDLIDASSLEPRTKADLRESVEEAKLNLNGRSLEERCASIARNQFDTTRFLAEIIIQFKNMADETRRNQNAAKKTGWKDVIIAVKWPLCILGSVIAVCAIFSENIVELCKALAALF